MLWGRVKKFVAYSNGLARALKGYNLIMKHNPPPKEKATVINITGLVPDGKDILLQSVHPMEPLRESLALYLANKFTAAVELDVQSIQGILNTKAQAVIELKAFTFESNQRVGELIALVSIAASINQLNKNSGTKHTDFVPAWQTPNQSEAVKMFTKKESWDGFIYEHVPLGTDTPSMKVVTVPVEIKSLMIHPVKESFTNLNALLADRMPKFSKYFQSEGSIGAVFVLPYANNVSSKITFDLKDATLGLNDHVNPATVGVFVFFDIHAENGTTYISTRTHFVSKNPILADNGNIKQIDLFELKWCKY